jgi:hypothetical protein
MKLYQNTLVHPSSQPYFNLARKITSMITKYHTSIDPSLRFDVAGMAAVPQIALQAVQT